MFVRIGLNVVILSWFAHLSLFSTAPSICGRRFSIHLKVGESPVLCYFSSHVAV